MVRERFIFRSVYIAYMYMYVPSLLPISIYHHLSSTHTPLQEHQLRPIEIQYGLLEVSEALLFLHADVKMMHGNLTPEAIVINAQGVWKVMGFNFCCYSHYQSEAQVTQPPPSFLLSFLSLPSSSPSLPFPLSLLSLKHR